MKLINKLVNEWENEGLNDNDLMELYRLMKEEIDEVEKCVFQRFGKIDGSFVAGTIGETHVVVLHWTVSKGGLDAYQVIYKIIDMSESDARALMMDYLLELSLSEFVERFSTDHTVDYVVDSLIGDWICDYYAGWVADTDTGYLALDLESSSVTNVTDLSKRDDFYVAKESEEIFNRLSSLMDGKNTRELDIEELASLTEVDKGIPVTRDNVAEYVGLTDRI